MKVRSRSAILSAAVAASLCAVSAAHADLIWNPGQSPTGGTDGSGNWDTTTTNWYDPAAGVNPVIWDNVTPGSAIFGDTTSAGNGTTSFNVELSAALNAQNVTFGTATTGEFYTVSDFNGGALTLYGNLTKASSVGGVNFLLVNNSLTLAAGNHTFAMRDTAGDGAELTVNGAIAGAGGLVVDNGTFDIYGTLVSKADNTYAGGTTVNKGRYVITSSGGLGTGSATISGLGILTVGGAGAAPAGNVTIDNAINITRSVYSGGTGTVTAGYYPDAFASGNQGPLHSVTVNNLVIDSTDGRVAANTSTLSLPNTVLAGATAGATSVLTLDGDFAGTINLGGNNSGSLAVGAIKMMGGVEVNFTNINNLGGASKPLQMAGGTLHVPANFTSDTQLNIATTGFGGGFDVDGGNTFTVAGNYTGSSIGKRGLGVLNITGTSTFTGGQTFFDSGTVNISGTLALGSLHLRSPVVNITGSVTTNSGFDSFGADSTATNGGPDLATVNISSTGSLVETTGDDFNVSDSVNTAGTINLNGGRLTTGGITFLGKNRGAVGTIVQNGGTFTVNRGGNFGFVLGDGRNGSATNLNSAQGFYTLNAGTFTSAGEVYLGEGNSNTTIGTTTTNVIGRGTWIQTGGVANINNYFVMGREGAAGTFVMSSGVLNHTGGDFRFGDGSNALGVANTVAISGDAVINNNGGEFWNGNGIGDKLVMTMSGSSVITTNNWFSIGRSGGQASLDLSGNASIIHNGVNNSYVGETTNAVTSTLTLRDSSSFTANTGEFWVGQGGGVGILNIQDTAHFSVNNWLALGRANGASIGTLNLSGGTLTKTGGGFLAVGSGGTGVFNQTGGVAAIAGTRLGEASNGTMNLSGGTDTFTGEFSVGYSGSGTLNLSGTAKVTAPQVVFGANGGGATGLINLNGGTLIATSIVAGSSTGSKVLMFNGGTLSPAVGTANFVGTLMTSTVSTGGAKINLNNQSVTFNSVLAHDATLAGADGGLGVYGSGTLVLPNSSTYTGSTIVNLAPGNASALRVKYATSGITPSTPILTGAGADIQSGDLIFDYTGSTSPLTTVVGDLAASYATGFTTGQLRSSTATSTRGLGYNDDGVSALTVKYTYYGDANLDGKVDISDLGALASHFQMTSNWAGGDFNYDGLVNITDLGLLATNFQAGVGNPLAISFNDALKEVGLGGAVPEPGSLSLLALAGIVAGRRRRAVV